MDNLGRMVLQLIWIILYLKAGFSSALPCSARPGLSIVKRNEWGANEPKQIDYMPTPVNKVFIHHTAMAFCHDVPSCSVEMRKIQDFHMITRGWNDIGYSYLVGEDGLVYEGRGWDREGAHTKGFNRDAIGISVMGDFTWRTPNKKALRAVRNLIQSGIAQNKITPNFRMYGHRDVRDTACPGDAFYQLIQTWPHYDFNKPTHDTIIG